jgi:alkylation response protein AidB-like acyl-CoA dehydrogenase
VRAEGVHVPADHRLGEEGEGFKIAMACLDNGRFTVGAGSVGLIGAALEASVAYAKKRTSFGREIGKQQLLQAKIAAMTRDYALGQLLVAEVARLKNAGLRNTRETSLLKWFATDAAFEAANAALQIHGAAGYSDTHDVERMLRNTRASQIYEGTNEIHQLIQAGYALGYRRDATLRCELPAFDRETWQS